MAQASFEPGTFRSRALRWAGWAQYRLDHQCIRSRRLTDFQQLEIPRPLTIQVPNRTAVVAIVTKLDTRYRQGHFQRGQMNLVIVCVILGNNL